VKVHDRHLAQTVCSDWPVLNAGELGQKRIVEPHGMLTGDVVPIGGIVVPSLGSRFSFESMDPGDALSAIAPASLSGLLGGNTMSLERIASLVSRYPCYRLILDDDFDRNMRGLSKLIEELPSKLRGQ
jgi:hypothetical protein